MEAVLRGLRTDEPEQIESAIRQMSGVVRTQNNESAMEQLTEELFDLIWRTPTFKKQVALIDSILENCGLPAQQRLLSLVLARFASIRSDRKDKFYYFIDRSIHLLSFADLLGAEDSGLLLFFCKHLNKNRPADWDDGLFLEFLARSQPWVCELFDEVRVPEAAVRPLLNRNLPIENRRALYGLFRKA
ncbi:hypothetical protein PAPHI01_1892 [Pancytospora philotis]|nr:hypothetical protein PAPHI01_1892 [Pancytospora philotis]